LLAILHQSFAPTTITFCEVKHGEPQMKSLPQPGYNNYIKNHVTYLAITENYVRDEDPEIFCVSCERSPPSDCHANCDPGYEWNSGSLNCTDINECSSVPATCVTCTNAPGDYSCICADGYTGKDCGEDIDECANDPSLCQHEGICHNEPGDYSCECTIAFTGKNCEDYRDCVDPNPCLGIVGVDLLPTIYLTDPAAGVFCEDGVCWVAFCPFPGTVWEPDATIIPLPIFPCFPPHVPGEIDCDTYNPCQFLVDEGISGGNYYLPSVSSGDPAKYIICNLGPISETSPRCAVDTCPDGTVYDQNWCDPFSTCFDLEGRCKTISP